MAVKELGSKMSRLRENIAKAIPDDKPIVQIDPNSLRESLPHIKSGSIVLDHLVGGTPNSLGVSPCPGWPKGKVINVYGPNSCGKTTLALEAASVVCAAGGTVVYIDWENEIVPGYASALGIPIGDQERFMLCQPDTLEDGQKIMFAAAYQGIDLIVVDSVGAGVPKATREKTLKELTDTPRIGLLAQAWSQFLPNLKSVISKTGTVVIGISQIRKNIATRGYGDDTSVQGGEAWKFFSAIRMKLARISYEKAKMPNAITNKTEEVVIGAVIKAKLEKNKVSSSQGSEQLFFIRWGQGFDDVRSVIDLARSHNLIKGSTWLAWVDPNGETQKFQGMERCWSHFNTNARDFEILLQQVRPLLGSAARYVASEHAAEGSGSDDEELPDEDQDLMNDLQQIGQGVPEPASSGDFSMDDL